MADQKRVVKKNAKTPAKKVTKVTKPSRTAKRDA
jgi:hypothetical protein